MDGKVAVLVARHVSDPSLRKQWVVSDRPLLVGRASPTVSPNRDPDKLPIDFSPALSRRHFTVTWQNGKLAVKRLPTASSPVYYQGEAVDAFAAAPGEVFGAGDVLFHIEWQDAPAVGDEPAPFEQLTLSWDHLQDARQRNARRCLDAVLKMRQVLTRDMPVAEFLRQSLSVIRETLSLREEILLLEVSPRPRSAADDGHIERDARGVTSHDPFPAPPSRRLVRKALESGCTELYRWRQQTEKHEFTLAPNLRWACCCPVAPEIVSEERFVYYLMGFDPAMDSDQVAVVQLVAEMASEHLRAASAMKLNYQVGQFFSPPIRGILFSSQGLELLRPKLTPVIALFFDLRGFSLATEDAERQRSNKAERDRNVTRYYQTLSTVLSEATDSIFQKGGTIIDYQGDAIIACWGAPQPQADMATRAARTALDVVRKVHSLDLPFGKQVETGRILKCGVGMAAGEAMEGLLNAGEQLKYSLIGSVMNVASRLEGLTKYLRVPVLVTGDFVRRLKDELAEQTAESAEDDVLCRRVGHVQPAGMANAVEVYEIVTERTCGGSGVSARDVDRYHQALACCEQMQFDEATDHLSQLPHDDPVARFLSETMSAARSCETRTAWDGIIKLEVK